MRLVSRLAGTQRSNEGSALHSDQKLPKTSDCFENSRSQILHITMRHSAPRLSASFYRVAAHEHRLRDVAVAPLTLALESTGCMPGADVGHDPLRRRRTGGVPELTLGSLDSVCGTISVFLETVPLRFVFQALHLALPPPRLTGAVIRAGHARNRRNQRLSSSGYRCKYPSISV